MMYAAGSVSFVLESGLNPRRCINTHDDSEFASRHLMPVVTVHRADRESRDYGRPSWTYHVDYCNAQQNNCNAQ